MNYASVFRRLTFSMFIWGTLFCAYPVFSAPTPTVTANDGSTRVLMMMDMLLKVMIELDPSSEIGRNADWWCVAEIVPGNYFSYQLDGSWKAGISPSYQGPLMTLPPYQVLNLGGLPSGSYRVYFGVDLNMNGSPDGNLYLDSVEISLPPFDCPEVTQYTQIVLSASQRAFVASRGNPDLFTLSFVSEELDDSGHVAYSPTIRRIETWVYNQEKLTTVLFDNGYFISETTHDVSANLQATPLSPSFFTHCMSRDDIVEIMGEPSCTKTEIMAGRTYSYLRYNPSSVAPAATLVLENDVLISVMAGYSFVYPASAGADLCAEE